MPWLRLAVIASDRVAESSIVSACFRSFFRSVKKLAPGRLVFQRLSIQLFLIQLVDVCCRIVVLQGACKCMKVVV